MNEITYKHIPLKELYSWAENIISKSNKGDFVPITLHRAKAMQANPYAAPEDVSMIAAYLGEKCVGFFGVMPIMVKLGDSTEKISWFTTWTVSPETRGMGVGGGLLKSALTIKEDFMIVGSHFAVRACEKQGFDKFDLFEYAMIDLRTMGRVNPISFLMRLARKVSTKFNKELNIEKNIQKINNSFGTFYIPITMKMLYSNTLKQLPANLNEVEIEQVKNVSEIDHSLMPNHAFLRDEKVINWMLDHPWVAKTGASATEKMDYYFTDARDEFEMQAFEFKKDGQKIAWLTLMVTKIGESRRQIRVLDCIAKPEHLPYIQKFIIEKAHKYGAVQIIGDTNVLNVLSKTSMKNVYQTKSRVYQTFTSKESVFANQWQKITQRFADGDMAFT